MVTASESPTRRNRTGSVVKASAALEGLVLAERDGVGRPHRAPPPWPGPRWPATTTATVAPRAATAGQGGREGAPEHPLHDRALDQVVAGGGQGEGGGHPDGQQGHGPPSPVRADVELDGHREVPQVGAVGDGAHPHQGPQRQRPGRRAPGHAHRPGDEGGGRQGREQEPAPVGDGAGAAQGGGEHHGAGQAGQAHHGERPGATGRWWPPGPCPAWPRWRWTRVRTQARAAPTRMDWAWVSVPK